MMPHLLVFQRQKKKEASRGPRLSPPLLQKKINGFARYTKMGQNRSDGGGRWRRHWRMRF